MAPSKASGTTAKKTRTVSLGGTPPSALKQGKLDFSSLKRNTSASTSAKEKVVSKVGVEPTSAKTSPKAVATKLFSEKEAITKRTETTSPASSPTLYSSSVAERPQKRAKTSDASLSPPISINIDESSSEEEPDEPEDLDVLEKSGKLRRYLGQVKEKTGNVPPIHGDKTRDSVNILRVFDLSYEYGPCIGMSRMERWERAHELGLNPPTEVRDILLTKQGQEEECLAQNVFYDEV